MKPIQTTGGAPPGSDRNLTALVLCGGRGQRLRPWSDTVPKPLMPVNGEPLLLYLLEHLAHAGVRDFLLCTGYKASLFDRFVQRYALRFGRLRSLDSGEASMSQRLTHARDGVSDRALVCYGDTLADVDLAALLGTHERAGREATLTVYPYQSPFGIVAFDEDGMVRTFAEKPRLPYWINIGFLLLEPAALQRLHPDLPFPGFLDQLARAGQLGVHPHRGEHWTANTEAEFLELARHFEPAHPNQQGYATERT